MNPGNAFSWTLSIDTSVVKDGAKAAEPAESEADADADSTGQAPAAKDEVH